MNNFYGVNLTGVEKEMLAKIMSGAFDKKQENRVKLSVNLVGRQFQDKGDKVQLGSTVYLKREPENKFDPEAIAIYVGRDRVGYVANSVKTMIQGCCSAGYVSGLLDAYGVTDCPVGKVKYFSSWACIVEVAF